MKIIWSYFKPFFDGLFRKLVGCFKPRYLWWHALAILLTYISVMSGFDWWYFENTRNIVLLSVLFPAAVLGFFVPIFAPLGVLIAGFVKGDNHWIKTGYVLVQAVFIGWLVSVIYKGLSGRAHPEVFSSGPFTDITREFHFGFMERGFFWGWPSSHTTVAFALSTALIFLFPRSWIVKILAVIYAVYIGIGVSATIHWFSDFIAGVIFGTLVGFVVGRGK